MSSTFLFVNRNENVYLTLILIKFCKYLHIL